MQSVLRAGSPGLKVAAAALDSVSRTRQGVSILIYHRVGGHSDLAVDLPRELFREQMAELADRAISLDQALVALGDTNGEEAGAGGEPPVVVTFDDGTADVVDEALPILVEYKIPAVLYVATKFVEDGRSFPRNGSPASWSALADAASTGCLTLGSHTHSHALLDRLEPGEIADELDRSRDLIHARTGVEATHFAYPKALAGSAAAEREVRERFQSAALAGTRINCFGDTDPWRLARSPIQVADGMRWFRAKAGGGLRLEDNVRRLVNRARYRKATE